MKTCSRLLQGVTKTGVGLGSSQGGEVPPLPMDPVLEVISKPLHQIHELHPELRKASVSVWAQWLGIGKRNLTSWRDQVQRYTSALSQSSGADEKQSPGSDASLLRWGADSGCILSPAVQMMEAPVVGGSTFIANREIPSGMFLLSVPRQMCLEVPEPTFRYPEDPLAAYVAQIEELILRLLKAVAVPSDPHHGYASYLRFSQAPPRNLPFLSESSFKTELGQEVWAAFEQAAAKPYHPQLRGIPEDEYRWAASMVLSRRSFGSMIHPWADKLNHGATANTFSTLAEHGNLTGVDVADNLYAGVPESCLFEPYLHCTTLNRVKRGEALVMSYSDQDPQDKENLDGRDSWLSNWGMVPSFKPIITQEGLRQTAVMLTKHRVINRDKLFPLHESERR